MPNSTIPRTSIIGISPSNQVRNGNTKGPPSWKTVVDGVRTIVVYDEDWHAGVLLEPEVRFHAQANDGTIWHFGEYREENNVDGKLVEPRAWVPDQKGAREGISMQAEPRLGTPSYAEGYAPPPVEWIDRGWVYLVDQKTCVPVDCYGNGAVIEEFERNKPGAYQTKYYALGVGEVRTGWRGEKEEERETVKLIDYQRLSPEVMAKTREKAIELDRRRPTRGRSLLEVHQRVI